ncbi:pterin-4a-carbinolamine dehydratase [Patulibacter medicamentivorans]|jgi:4a-hydroxytetrahydrobiopterin dehydratase|uniref:Putative pterin-4-alpha-carbinolamine dehydratase n=1 Tax=Patulibacter medicamentivorans TaxID=1097667 RepID=H0E8Z8_9ACTN|nr:4a-hydroxytetrahydrobiopterin dehydratase [Patulibacter medicamentivorans]EHN09851.1 pterin-4a-carbinolamine dehydratase [Patulibacter medicamentivorans]
MADLIDGGRLAAWTAGRAWAQREGGLEREWTFPDFAAALEFVNAVGGLAEAQGHHPDIHLHDWNRVGLRLRTHSAGGITDHDLELAERVDELQDRPDGAG